MRPEPPRLARRGETVAIAEEQQDVRGLADEEATRLEERRRKRRPLGLLVAEQREHRALVVARDVDIVGAGLFERQAHELAASLDGGPVIELVAHGSSQSVVCSSQLLRTANSELQTTNSLRLRAVVRRFA